MKTAKVYIQFPRTGLGNRLLVWSRGYVFVSINGLRLITSPWRGIHWGAWIRWERKKRVYWRYFKENTRWERLKIALQRKSFGVVNEPAIEQISLAENEKALFLFNRISTDNDLFGPIRAHRSLVRQGINDILMPSIKGKLEKYKPPVISVHIRRGDFKLGNPITPTDFFIKAINLARDISGMELPVTVFTDAQTYEIKDVLALPNVALADNNPDILDILLMSKSKVIVLSRSSTFSYWGAFLSDAIIIKPEEDWQNDLRPAEVNKNIFEGKVNFQDEDSLGRLKDGLKSYKW